jgi:hypothetical protein
MSEQKPKPSDDNLEFLKTAIHDLNNHLGIVMATAELLRMGPAEGRSQSRLAMIESKAQEASTILKEISRRYFG